MEEFSMFMQKTFHASVLAIAIGAGMLAATPQVQANRALSDAWSNYYSLSSSDENAGCALCHGANNLFPLNSYGADWQSQLLDICGAIENCNLNQLETGLQDIEGLDSDAPNDLTQSTNIEEINADTQPGWAESDAPSGVAGLLDPEQQVAGCVPFVSPNVIDFGTLDPGDSVIASADVTNNGDATCDVTAEVFNASEEFALVSAAVFSVAPAESVSVDVSYTPIDIGDDTGQLVLTYPESNYSVQLVGSSSYTSVDMDIKSLRVTKKVSASKARGVVDVQLTVENGGDTEGPASATITGVQDGSPVYAQTITVSDPLGGGATTYTFQSYIPEVAGDITWTATIDDDDPDEDVETATTVVTP
jgi:hypothetical protein